MGIDIQVRPSSSVAVSGRVTGPDGPAAKVAVRLVPDDAGEFTFLGVPPGRYRVRSLVGANAWAPRPGSVGFLLTLTVEQNVIRAAHRPPAEPLYWMEETVTVGQTDVAGLVGRLEPGMRLSGRVQFDGDAALPGRDGRMRVTLEPLETGPLGASTVAFVSGSDFETGPYPPGRYRFVIDHPNGQWRVSKVMLDGRDVYDEAIVLGRDDIRGLVVHMTDVATTLSGTALAPAGAGDARAEVLAFPADYERWIDNGMIDRAAAEDSTTDTGAYVLTNMRPGRYLIAAVPPNAPSSVRDPDFIRSIVPLAERVTVAAGPNVAPTVRIARPR